MDINRRNLLKYFAASSILPFVKISNNEELILNFDMGRGFLNNTPCIIKNCVFTKNNKSFAVACWDDLICCNGVCSADEIFRTIAHNFKYEKIVLTNDEKIQIYNFIRKHKSCSC